MTTIPETKLQTTLGFIRHRLETECDIVLTCDQVSAAILADAGRNRTVYEGMLESIYLDEECFRSFASTFCSFGRTASDVMLESRLRAEFLKQTVGWVLIAYAVGVLSGLMAF